MLEVEVRPRPLEAQAGALTAEQADRFRTAAARAARTGPVAAVRAG